jgi:hypothetical protein
MACIKLMSKVLLPLPTELADGLRLEGVCLRLSEIRPKIGSSVFLQVLTLF